jgi:hypothetical protein
VDEPFKKNALEKLFDLNNDAPEGFSLPLGRPVMIVPHFLYTKKQRVSVRVIPWHHKRSHARQGIG